MFHKAEKPTVALVPIKSSLSLILGDAQVWSNSMSVSSQAVTREVNCSGEEVKLDVFAQRLVERKKTVECVKKTKKSRQVFTFSQPPVVCDFTGGNIEVYESGSGCGMEPHLLEEVTPRVYQPVRTAELGKIQRPASKESAFDSDSKPAHVSCLLPLEVRSEIDLRRCFATPAVSGLLYSVSDSSLPVLKRSSLTSCTVSNQDPTFGQLVIPPKPLSMYTVASGRLDRTSNNMLQGRSIVVNQCKDIMIKCGNMDDVLARRIADNFRTVTDRARRGRFLSYAKFNSSFKLPEVFYEDDSLPHVPSFQVTKMIQVNPDFDENQSTSDGMTAKGSLSTITRLSRVPRVRLPSSSTSKTARTSGGYYWSQSIFSSVKPSESTEVSPRPRTRVTFSRDVAYSRPTLTELHNALKVTFHNRQLEQDVWSTASTNNKELTVTPKRLVDLISPSCVFKGSPGETEKRPLWQLKEKHNVNRSIDLINDFIFKAHNYMRVRDRPNTFRCYFQLQPTYRVVDESVQFPDVALPLDRPSNTKESIGHCASEYNQDSPSTDHQPEMKTDQECGPEMLAHNASTDDNQPLSVITISKPFESSSEYQATLPTVEESIMNTSSPSNYHISSAYPVSTTVSFQCRDRKPIKPRLPPVAEDPTPNRPRIQRVPRPDRFCRSYRALCDKRRIKIKYENGRYIVMKEMSKAKRRTIWSMLTGKVTHLLKLVKRPQAQQAPGPINPPEE